MQLAAGRRPAFPVWSAARQLAKRRSMQNDAETIAHTFRAILVAVLGVSRERASTFTAETGLFGALPELDSMAVAGLLTEIEDRLGIVIDDDEVDGEMLETFGSLVAFAVRKSRE